MDVDGVLDHLKGWHGASFLVFRMRCAQIREIETVVEFVGGHRRLGGIDDDEVECLNA